MEVTVVLTSCGRLELLERTINSFRKYNTYPITEFIIIDDADNPHVRQVIKKKYSDCTLIIDGHRGQVQCIDEAYSRVKTPYIFHMEDDWEFTRGGFIEPSLKILEADPNILLVWILHNGFPVEPELFKAGDVEYHLLGHVENWHGFTWNPSLRRLSEYNLVKPYMQWFDGVDSAHHENRIGKELYDHYGYRGAILNDDYCFHTGAHDQKRPTN